MDNRKQYIEPLIKLIEINDDKYWLYTFYNLREIGYLAGGGAGSVYDWSPSFSNNMHYSWYNHLYEILLYLLNNNLPAEKIDLIDKIKNWNKVSIIRCLNCYEKYQHPKVFESHIALYFYKKNFHSLAKKQLLLDLFNPEITYNSTEVNIYRNKLIQLYQQLNIEIYDFIANDYLCPHCNKNGNDIRLDNYYIQTNNNDDKTLMILGF